MTKPKRNKTLYMIDPQGAEMVREQACAHLGYDHFAELAVCAMVKQLLKKERGTEALELLRSYCKKYPLTTPVIRLMQQQNLSL